MAAILSRPQCVNGQSDADRGHHLGAAPCTQPLSLFVLGAHVLGAALQSIIKETGHTHNGLQLEYWIPTRTMA